MLLAPFVGSTTTRAAMARPETVSATRRKPSARAICSTPSSEDGHREYGSLSVTTCENRSSRSPLPEFLGEADENSFGSPDVAEPIRIFVLDHLADELCAALAEPGERIFYVLHGEHDA